MCNFLSFLNAVTHEILEKKGLNCEREGKKDKLKYINNSWNVDLRFQYVLKHFVKTLSAFSRVCFSSFRWTS